MYRRACAQRASGGSGGARSATYPSCAGDGRSDRRRGCMPSRRRPRRDADGDGLWPRGGRNFGSRGRGDLRRQGTPGVQSADRPCPGHRGGARAGGVQRRGRAAGQRVLARTADACPAGHAVLQHQLAGARRPRHRRASFAVAPDGARAHRGGRARLWPRRRPIRRAG